MSKIEERNLSPEICQTIKLARKRKGMSLAELAQMVNVSASYLQRIENGLRACPSSNILKRIGETLNIDIFNLLISKKIKSHDLALLVQGGDYFVGQRKLNQEEKAFLLTCIDALESDWDKKYKGRFIMELFEQIERIKTNHKQ